MSALTAAFVKSVRHRGGKSADRYRDGHGLLLQVMPNGSKQWLQRLALDGKLVEREVKGRLRRWRVTSDYGLGGYPERSLSEVRKLAFANAMEAREYRRARDRGETPPLPAFERNRLATMARRNGQPAPAAALAHDGLTFAEAFERVLEVRSPSWKENVRKAELRSWRAHLRDYLQPIARLPVARLTSADLQRCLEPVWGEKPKTAAKVLRRVGTVLEWAVAENLRTDNPARAVARARPRAQVAVKHYKALPYAEVPGALAQVGGCKAPEAAKLALRLLVLTALRSNEVRLAEWSEVDLDRAVWTVPAARMKYTEQGDHRVPLSAQAVAVLKAAGPRRSGLVFRSSRTGNALSDGVFRELVERAGVGASPHGFRSSFRDFAADHGYSREIAEAALAHTVGGVEAAYRRTDLFERRRALMAAWGGHVAGVA